MMRTTPDALVLVTSADCHLCEHAWQVLDALDRPVCEVDVASAEAGELAARGVALAFPPS